MSIVAEPGRNFQDGPISEHGVNGTTNEAILEEVLIPRIESLNAVMPCAENEIALGHLHHALTALQERTKAREARGVEGTSTP